MSAAFSPFKNIKKEMASPPKEKFIRPPVTTKMASIATKESYVMNDKRKKVVAVGWLVICVASIINESGRYEWGTPSLSWLILLCATWALAVWLWPNNRIQIKRSFRLLSEKRRRKQRCEVAALIRENFLEEKMFEGILNAGKNHPWVALPKDCASNGWRRMSHGQLAGAKVLLRTWAEDRLSSIHRCEKLIRKGKATEADLLQLARERRPNAPNWRSMNWGELKMMIAIITGEKKDFDFLR